MEFGRWLRLRRRELDMTQQELARQIGCSVETVKKLEGGGRRPSKLMAGLLAQMLAVPPQERERFVRFARSGTDGEGAIGTGGNPFSGRETAGMEGSMLLAARRLAHPNNLPVPPNSFIGREGEIEEACRLLTSEGVRLLNLLGPPGIGKTRLSVQVGEHLLGKFPDGVYFVPLEGVRQVERVAPAVALALGLREGPGRSLQDSLRRYLRPRFMLLVLDNFEQITAAGPLLGELLETSPGLKMLVTSRARLRIYGEHEMVVPPLSIPAAPGDMRAGEPLRDLEAVRLFVDRARAVRPGFAGSQEDDTDISLAAEICYRLDGLPLAIELAASNLERNLPETMLAQMERRLGSLTGGAWNLPERQQTLRAAIDWSYDLLNAWEQQLFRRLAVFAGGCTPEAAQAVCSAGGRNRVEAGLDSLVDKSLLKRDLTARGVRYEMLQTIREFAWERLAAEGETGETLLRHARFFTELAERAEPHLYRSSQQGWSEALDAELGNFAELVDLAGEVGKSDETEGVAERRKLALRMGGALGQFWYRRGYITEGRKLVLDALAKLQGEVDESDSETLRSRIKALNTAGYLCQRGADEDQALPLYEEAYRLSLAAGDTSGQAHALKGLADIAYDRSDYEEAKALYLQSLDLFREIGDAFGEARVLREMGNVALMQGDTESAGPVLENSLALFAQLGDTNGQGTLYGMLGTLKLYSGEYDEARDYYERALGVFRPTGDKNSIAICLNNLAEVERCTHRYEEGRALLEQGLKLWRELDDTWCMTMSMHNLGCLCMRTGNVGRAYDLFVEGVELAQRIGARRGVGLCAAGLAGALGTRGEWDRAANCRKAARLYGAAVDTLEAIGTPLQGADYEDHTQNMARVRDALGDELFHALMEEGKDAGVDNLTLEFMPGARSMLFGRAENAASGGDR